MRSLGRTIVIASLIVAPGIVRAADDRDLFLSSIVARAAEKSVAPEAAGREPGDVLATVAGVRSFPVACATPLVDLFIRPDASLAPGLLPAAAAVAGRPSPEAEKISLTRDGRFALHYAGGPSASGLMSVDRDRNGVPDLVDRVGEALQASRSYLVTRLGYPPPAAEGERLDLYLMPLGHSLEGYAVPRPDGPGFIVLDSALTADRVMPATLHQVSHLSLLSLSPRAPRWWTEGSASFLTLLATGDMKSHEASLRARLQAPGEGLASDGMLLMEGSMLWPLFLAERFGDPSVVRQVWEEMAAQGLDPLAAADSVLRRSDRSLLDAWREFVAWNLFTGDRDDGQHYSAGRSMPTSALSPAGTDVPLRLETSDPVEPMGTAAFRLALDDRRGTIDFEIAAEGGRPAADLFVYYRPWGQQPVLVPAPAFDGAGTARVSVPWADAREAWIVLRNDALPGGGSARFEVRANADAYAPYDLAALSASDVGSSILLEWTTASEQGLQAWNIYRSEAPGGPFTRLNSVAVPAMGDSSGETGYIYVDDFARPGRRYYYLLEGLTNLGLPQRSHVVSGRIAQRN
jgi:hypothetical protein